MSVRCMGLVRGRLARPLKKELAVTRWMGCKIAVYDLTVQAKAGTRAETSRSSRGSKRRGRRGKCEEGRKRRRMAPAAPTPQNPLVHQATQFRRDACLVGRREAWAERRLDQLMVLWSKWHHSHKGSSARGTYRRGYLAGCQRWAAVSAAASRESVAFALVRLRVVLKVKTFGWESLPTPATEAGTEIVPLAPAEKPLASEEAAGDMSDPETEHICFHTVNHIWCGECGGCILRNRVSCTACVNNPRRDMRRVVRTTARKTRPRVGKPPGFFPPVRQALAVRAGTSWSSGSESETEREKKGKGKRVAKRGGGSVRSPWRRGGGQ